MTIYLACTVRGDRGGVTAGRAICDRLQRAGHDVLTTHLLADNVDAAEAALTERDVYERDLRWLTSCDVLVAEASGSSYGVGFEVGYGTARSRASSPATATGPARHSDTDRSTSSSHSSMSNSQTQPQAETATADWPR